MSVSGKERELFKEPREVQRHKQVWGCGLKAAYEIVMYMMSFFLTHLESEHLGNKILLSILTWVITWVILPLGFCFLFFFSQVCSLDNQVIFNI